MRKIACIILLLLFQNSFSQKIEIENSNNESVLLVDGKPFLINGMNWDYYPIGTNYNYSLWKQSDDFIKKALDREMSMLKEMNVNVIRQYTGIPPKWITYIYEKYGIFTMLNHSFGRYGLTLNGAWVQNTEYSNPLVKSLLLKEVSDLANEYKNTKGLLLYLLGNENNYGLFWDGAETENIPIEERKSTERAKAMYKLFNDGAVAMRNIDNNHPIAICNGDLLFLDIIAKECPNFDIFGTNMYRGTSFGDAFQKVKETYKKPILFTEFGSDSYNTITNSEDQDSQAHYFIENWKEIYQNVAKNGKSGNSIGGFTFQFSDGWWKYAQTKNLDLHDTNASWSNGGYKFDYEKSENNMNEEWFGICAKGKTDQNGFYRLYPRTAYYALQKVHQFNPYQSQGLDKLEQYFNQITLNEASQKAKINNSNSSSENNKFISLSKLTAEFTTFNTGGSLISTPNDASEIPTTYPSHLGFDHMQSFYIGVEANPAPNISANVEFNILGNVATNPIDEIFYENRGRKFEVETSDGSTQTINDNERVKLYRANFNWNNKWFNLEGFYRTGHYHWGYEGDFFGLYPEANYGPNIDIYNAAAPIGFELEARKQLKGLKIAFGPQLWWGANPAILAKYQKEVKNVTLTAIFHEDLEQLGNTESSFAIPQPKTRRATLSVQKKFGKVDVNLGGIWAGQPLVGRSYQVVRGDENNYNVYQNEITNDDTWGAKAKIMYSGGKLNWYAQAAAMGLVANGGADNTQTFTGWKLKDSGSGNQYNFLSGFTYTIGKLQIAPNFLWQKPLEDPIPNNVPAPGRPRNILDDPFVVRANREQMAGEILFTYDPTPATWMYEWDNDRAEDATFAISAGFVYRHLPTIQDAAIGIFPDGRTTFAFPGSAPAKDLWEIHSRIVSKWNKDFGFIANVYGGNAQANGSDSRTISRYGTDVRLIYKKMKFSFFSKFNDWGPYDYHRDFNLTFPVQLMLDISTEINKPDWFILPSTRIGIRGTWRSLDQYSPRYNPTQMLDSSGNWVPNPTAIGFDDGQEWEIRTYIQINLGK